MLICGLDGCGAALFQPVGDGETKESQFLPPLPSDQSKWLVLGIESSCDDTAAAVVDIDGNIRGEAIASQAGEHAVRDSEVPCSNLPPVIFQKFIVSTEESSPSWRRKLMPLPLTRQPN